VWVIPKNYEHSPSAQDTVESKEDLSLLESELERSLMWRSKPTQLPTWLRRWKRVPWIRALFGRMLKPSQYPHFEAQLTCLLEGIPVNPSRLQAREEEQMTLGIYGHTYVESSMELCPECVSLKMSKATSPSDCAKCSQIWKAEVTAHRGEYSQRKKLGHHTEGRGSSSWPTARTSDAEGGRIETEETEEGFRSKRKTSSQWFGAKLRDAVETHSENWSTPRFGGQEKASTRLARGKDLGLQGQVEVCDVMNCPTASTRDWKDTPGMARENTNKDGSHRNRTDRLARVVYGHRDQESHSETGKSQGRLNPAWVEQLMGLPSGLTDLGSWGMESYHKPQPDPSDSPDSEARVQSEIRLEASEKGLRLWRNNVGALPDQRGVWVRYGLCNESKVVNQRIKSADLIGIRPIRITPQHIGQLIGQFVSREVKAPSWTMRPSDPHTEAQLHWAELIASLGGDACFANSTGTL